MCGICGAVGLPSERAFTATERMVRALVHRGPDDEGLHQADGVVFQMRRLSILDLPGGKQPLSNEDSTIALVANGEIYNHRSLRRDLERLGHRFRTRSDCETIVHAYEQYGDDFLSHLRGMFAIAIHDLTRRRVILARDRLGEKPLYVADGSGGLLFASELRALLASGEVPTVFDPSSLYAFFHFGFIPEPETAIVGVHKLPAGHVLSIDLATGQRRVERYWDFQDVAPRRADAATVCAVREHTSALITDADVPVGVALSGGVDSGAIAIMAAARSPRSLHAFTVGYDEPGDSDETEFARAIATHAGLTFHPVRLSTADVVASYPETLWLKDDPNADITGPAYLAIARAARAAAVPVILLGHGGDELFWGYPWVVDAARRTRALRDGPREILRTWWGQASTRVVQHPRAVRRLIRRLRAWAGDFQSLLADLTAAPGTLRFYDTQPGYRQANSATGSFFTRALVRGVDTTRLTRFERRPEIVDTPPEAAVLRLICETYLRENGLAQSDRLSMAASVEARAPFMDHPLVELAYAHQVAEGRLIQGDKRLLRESVRSVCPPWLTSRPKCGFTPPVAAWSRAIFRRYAPLLDQGVLVAHGIITPAAGRRLAVATRARGYLPLRYHDAVALELWCRQILAGHPFGPDESVPAPRGS